jgi:hypothetical protein
LTRHSSFSARGQRRYGCRYNDERFDGTGKRCHCRTVEADWLDATVWEEVAALLRDPERLLTMVQQYLDLGDTQMQVDAQQLSRVDRSLSDAKRKRSNLALAAAATGPEAIAEALTEINRDIEELEKMREQARAWAQANAERAALVRELKTFATIARKHLDNPTPEWMREVFAALDIKVRIVSDGFARLGVLTTRVVDG